MLQRWRGAALLTLILGAVLVGAAVTNQRQAPEPARSAAGTTHTQLPTSPLVPPTTAAAPAKRIALPVSIAVPSIGVQSDMIQVGLNPDRTLEIPQPGPDYDKAAWYKYSPSPGQLGPSIIEGHVDSARGGPSVFFNLGRLRPGALVQITLDDSTVVTFTVTGVRMYDKTEFPTSEVYGDLDAPGLRLITCGGQFDRASGSYRSNIVAFATLVGS